MDSVQVSVVKISVHHEADVIRPSVSPRILNPYGSQRSSWI